MLPIGDGPLTVRSASPQRTHPGIMPAPAALFLLKDRRAAWPARLVVAVASSARMTGQPTGACCTSHLVSAPCGRAGCSGPSIGAGKPDGQEPVGAAAGREALAGQGEEDDEACRGRSP